MSTTSLNVGNSKSVVQNDASKQINLHPIFMQSFSINNNEAKCIKCNVCCVLKPNAIIFHLVVCSGTLSGEAVKTDFKLKCLICKFETKRLFEWKRHLFKLNHIVNSFNSTVTGYSYDCSSCETHFYGFEDTILKHKCRPQNLSMSSKLMAYVYESFDVQKKRMLYYCTDCLHYSHCLTKLHTQKHCEAATKSSTYICDTCLITFYGFSKNDFLNHKVSFEHMILWCINGKRTTPNKLSYFPKLPLCISKYFVTGQSLLAQICCNVCKHMLFASYESMYGHFKKCISSKKTSVADDRPSVRTINCDECNYTNSANELCNKDFYECWVDHVHNFKHLTKTVVKKKNYKLYSCYVDETIFYGKESFVKKKLLSKNEYIGRSLFVSEVMAEVYKHANTCVDCVTFYCCGFCLKYTAKKSVNCEHENSSELFYCSDCLVYFNIQSDYNEHLVSSEHVILKYFKPKQSSDVKMLVHSMENLKISSSNSNMSNDHDSKGISSMSDQSNSEDEICESVNIVNKNVESQNSDSADSGSCSIAYSVDEKCTEIENKVIRTPVQDYKINNESLNQLRSRILFDQNGECDDPEANNIVLNFIDKLSAQSFKSAFNNYLRMNFELLNQMPHAMNVFVESKSFYCAICDLVFCNQDDWVHHDNMCHNKTNNAVFYCEICHIYYISTSININIINNHINSLEHKVMVEFQEYKNKNKNTTALPRITNTVNATITNDVQVLKSENKNEKNSQISDQENRISKKNQRNKNTYIEIKDVNVELRGNNYSLLCNLIKEAYGEFKQVSNQSNSFIILFQYMDQITTMVGDKKKLEKCYGFNIQVIGQNEESVLSIKTIRLLSDWPALCGVIFGQLQTMITISNRKKIKTKIKNLCDSVRSLNNNKSVSIDVHVFGSRVYGLALNNSDVDLYVDVGGTFNGKIADNVNKQVSLVKSFAKQCLLKKKEFKNVEKICDARVPIIKFCHIPTMFNCDVSFKSGLSLYNSKLIETYLSMDSTVKWLVCVIVKNWALQNNLKDRNLFTSYALVWLVLFYLMTNKVVPSLVELVAKATSKECQTIEGWDCTFGTWSDSIGSKNRPKLLMGFFQYYSNREKLEGNVLCTYTGKCMRKNNFFANFSALPELTEIQRAKFKTFQSKVRSSFEKYRGLTLQDPFELSFNLTRNITDSNLINFCDLCNLSAVLLKSTKGCCESFDEEECL